MQKKETGGIAKMIEESTVLEEDNNSEYEPTEQEIIEYSRFLGMSLPEDRDLLYIAREGLKAPLPAPWKACKTKEGDLYYFNFDTGESIWSHPLDGHFRQKYLEAKALARTHFRKDQTRRYRENGEAAIEEYRKRKEVELKIEEERLTREAMKNATSFARMKGISGGTANSRRRLQQQIRKEVEQEYRRKREELGQGCIEELLKAVEDREKEVLERRLSEVYKLLHASHSAQKRTAEERLREAEEELKRPTADLGRTLRTAELALEEEKELIRTEFEGRLSKEHEAIRAEAEKSFQAKSSEHAADLESRKADFETQFMQTAMKRHVQAKDEAARASEARLLEEKTSLRRELESIVQEYNRISRSSQDTITLSQQELQEIVGPWMEKVQKARADLEQRKIERRGEKERAEGEHRERIEGQKRKMESERTVRVGALRRESERLTDELAFQSEKVKQLSQMLGYEAARLQSDVMERSLAAQLQQMEVNEMKAAVERAKEEVKDVKERLRTLSENEELAATLSRKIDALVKEIDEKENGDKGINAERRIASEGTGKKETLGKIDEWRSIVIRETEKVRLIKENVKKEKSLLRERQDTILRAKEELRHQTSSEARLGMESRRKMLNEQIRRLNEGLARFKEKEARLKMKERRLKELGIVTGNVTDVSFQMLRGEIERLFRDYDEIVIDVSSDGDGDDIRTVTSLDSQGEQETVLARAVEANDSSLMIGHDESGEMVNPFRAVLSQHRSKVPSREDGGKASTMLQFYLRSNYYNRSFEGQEPGRGGVSRTATMVNRGETRHNSLHRGTATRGEYYSFNAGNDSSMSRERPPVDLRGMSKVKTTSSNSRMSTGQTTKSLITPSPHPPAHINTSAMVYQVNNSYDQGSRVFNKSFLNF
eukprot:TRINITY_DN1507_c0_g2_i1.p1 TRINITY_DN1507_c0_g2~~TRINITY_DN1507_c0_g2_i1.p1  ORF type:complete len:890 (+),score=272.40 TRINITY_DN1507_c0_g2_i1:52-2721(+)